VRPEQIELVLEALDGLYQQIGLSGYDEATQVVRSKLARAGDPEQTTNTKIAMALGEYLFQQHAGAGWTEVLGKIKDKKLSTREELRQALIKAPDLTNEDLALIDKLRNAPKHVRASMKEVLRQIRPKGGHPWVVPPSDYGKICDEVAAKYRDGATLAEAKRQVARDHGCKVRTINSILQKRRESK
jgi:hypothetical protein